MTTQNDKTEPPVQAPPAEQPTSSTPPGSDAEAAAAEPTHVDPLVTLAAERDHLKEQLLRTAADFDNYRKRARREMEDARTRGKDDAIRDVLPVFDNLERAVAASDSAQSVTSVVEGVKMVLKLFQDTTERMGLNRVPTIGHRFDPAMHEAIQQKETDEVAAGTILNEVTPGYMFGQRLLRAAMVVVARKPAPRAADIVEATAHGAAAVSGAPPANTAAADATAEPAANSGRPSQAPNSSEQTKSVKPPKPEDGGNAE